MVISKLRRCKHLPPIRSYGTSIRQLLATETSSGPDITISGWIRSLRKGKNVSFLVINDGSSAASLQAILPRSIADAHDFTFGNSVTLCGQLVQSPKAHQKHEFKVDKLEYLGQSSDEYPLQKKTTSAEHLRTLAHLRPRTSFAAAVLRAQSSLLKGAGDHFHDVNFTQVLPPIITGSDCEGAGEVFSLREAENLFKKPAYLTVSSQLHLEALMMGLGNVWTISPTFRAEKSTTARHLSEFRMLEAEIAFATKLDQIMDVVENAIKHLTRVAQNLDDIKYIHTLEAENIEHVDLDVRWREMLGSWPRITYHHAIETLQSHSAQFQHPPSYESGLAAEHERFLASHHKSPVFVTQYPASQKPFYMLPSTSNHTVECFDLLVPSMGELCGGSLRLDNHEALRGAMQRHGINQDELQWYLDLRAHGSVPHGGFGIGWERLVGYLCGISNIREIAAFPRWANHCVA